MQIFPDKIFTQMRMPTMRYFLYYYILVVHGNWIINDTENQVQKMRHRDMERQAIAAKCSPKQFCPEVMNYINNSLEKDCQFYYEYVLCAATRRRLCVDMYLQEYIDYDCAPKATPPIPPECYDSASLSSPKIILPILILPILV
ncbi:uncharacterized protein LOC106874739 isoform X1 [Octopus bimaculoides]|uniref:uncharacterized protein LOC106874739 isoform X1 n=1 Tax=Octopus bimaculoides TaxID=37653 RepID=UPI0022E09A21|nr:uncharacterized protein LOC106874739 isoform X1 [Octopus bimaculoides]XP_052830397.1 uncharacterized protein LOC106874739 isoform X1 [Octopus bimaculoides]XP_052830398.1 uncharacterized protein LOC106874739 isoform X1 [Octopus bimaculoides]